MPPAAKPTTGCWRRCAPTPSTAPASQGKLTSLHDAHAAWWADWLEPRGAMPTDDILGAMEAYHANLRAALDWSADQPALGLRLLAGVARSWEALGRCGDAVAAADRLLTDTNAERHPSHWLEAANSSDGLYFLTRGPHEHLALLERVEGLAAQLGDEYHVALARWRREVPSTVTVLRDLARDRGDRYIEAAATITMAYDLAENEPAAAAPYLLEAQAVAEASGTRHLRDLARMAQAGAANSSGHLVESVELARGALEGPRSGFWPDAIRSLGFAALLARDDQALRFAVEAGDREHRKAPGPALWLDDARHRLQLLEGHASEVHPEVRSSGGVVPPTPGTLWLVGREAIDAGAVDASVAHLHAVARPEPHPQAVLAAVEAAATADEHLWHDTLTIALDQGLRLIAVDALEGLGVAAAATEKRAECLRLLAAAERLRDETGYRWRFAFEDRAVESARTAAFEALSVDADAARTEGRELTGARPPPTHAALEESGNGRTTAGPASPRQSTRSSHSSPRGSPIPRSANASSWAERPSRHTSSTSSPNSASARAPNSPAKQRGGPPCRFHPQAEPWSPRCMPTKRRRPRPPACPIERDTARPRRARRQGAPRPNARSSASGHRRLRGSVRRDNRRRNRCTATRRWCRRRRCPRPPAGRPRTLRKGPVANAPGGPELAVLGAGASTRAARYATPSAPPRRQAAGSVRAAALGSGGTHGFGGSGDAADDRVRAF